MSRSRFLSILSVLALSLPIAACDEGGEKISAADAPEASAATPSAGGEEAVPEGSSLSENSPAAEGVTAEEMPHSDVPPPSRAVFTDAECDYEGWVGKPVDEAAVKAEGRIYRVLTPDSMMTMDHNPERINVVHDKDGKVTRVWCG